MDRFVLTFSANKVCPALNVAIRWVHPKVFKDQEVVKYQPNGKSQETHYNLAIDEDNAPRNTGIPESEGHCDVHRSAVEAPEVTQPLKTWTVNIGSKFHPKYATSGDYWDKDTVIKATQLLHECRDLYLMKFWEIRGISAAVDDILSRVEAQLHAADGI